MPLFVGSTVFILHHVNYHGDITELIPNKNYAESLNFSYFLILFISILKNVQILYRVYPFLDVQLLSHSREPRRCRKFLSHL